MDVQVHLLMMEHGAYDLHLALKGVYKNAHLLGQVGVHQEVHVCLFLEGRILYLFCVVLEDYEYLVRKLIQLTINSDYIQFEESKLLRSVLGLEFMNNRWIFCKRGV
jgi:hypothetical protein